MAAPANQANGNHQEALRLLEVYGGAENAAVVQTLIGQINAAENQQGRQVVALPTDRELIERELALKEFKNPPGFAERFFGAYWARKGEFCRELLNKQTEDTAKYQRHTENLNARFFTTLGICARIINQERNQRAQVAAERDESQAQNRALTGTVAARDATIAGLNDQYAQKTQENENLRTSYTRVSEAKRVSDATLEQKELALTATTNERDFLRGRITNLEQQVTHFKTSNEQLGKMHDELQSLSKETSTELRRSKKSIKKLASELSEKRELTERQKEHIETLIPEKNQLEELADTFRIRLAEKDASISRLSCHRTAAATSVFVLIFLGLFVITISQFSHQHEL